jgi:hypothetical protein
MSQILADAELARQLAAATGPVQIVNEQGTMIAFCMPVSQTRSAPLTPEEIEQRRKDLAPVREQIRKNPKSGKSLAEIMANLNRLAGEGS